MDNEILKKFCAKGAAEVAHMESCTDCKATLEMQAKAVHTYIMTDLTQSPFEAIAISYAALELIHATMAALIVGVEDPDSNTAALDEEADALATRAKAVGASVGEKVAQRVGPLVVEALRSPDPMTLLAKVLGVPLEEMMQQIPDEEQN